VELCVLRSPQREEFTRILLQKDRGVASRFMPPQRKLAVVTLDNTRSSQRPDFRSRPPETASIALPPDEPFRLRVFVDRGIVEVFINNRQCLASRVHPIRADSTSVSLRAQSSEGVLRSLAAWKLKSIQP
jgi:beta-fructofuranosidase